MRGIVNFGLTCIYCNLSNETVGIIYWLSTATHRFKSSSNSVHHVLWGFMGSLKQFSIFAWLEFNAIKMLKKSLALLTHV